MSTDFERGDALYGQLVRGDAMIGLIADVGAHQREMLAALWAAAAEGHGPAFVLLGDCHLAWLQPDGAFDGVDPADADQRPWSAAAAAISADEPALQAALRAYHEAAALGDRLGLRKFVATARHGDEAVKRRALSLLAALSDPSPADIYQRGLVELWLGDRAASAGSHHAAAEGGDLDAQFELALYFGQGIGVGADPAQAAAWLTRAADGGHPRALYNLGSAHATGTGVPRDVERAAAYYRQAADRGHGRAAATIAAMILGGELSGTPTEAAALLDQADACGFAAADLLDAAGLDDPRAAAEG